MWKKIRKEFTAIFKHLICLRCFVPSGAYLTALNALKVPSRLGAGRFGHPDLIESSNSISPFQGIVISLCIPHCVCGGLEEQMLFGAQSNQHGSVQVLTPYSDVHVSRWSLDCRLGGKSCTIDMFRNRESQHCHRPRVTASSATTSGGPRALTLTTLILQPPSALHHSAGNTRERCL